MERGRPRMQPNGYFYDDLYCARRGEHGHPSIVIEREPTEGWLSRAREALSFGSDRRFEMIVRKG